MEVPVTLKQPLRSEGNVAERKLSDDYALKRRESVSSSRQRNNSLDSQGVHTEIFNERKDNFLTAKLL